MGLHHLGAELQAEYAMAIRRTQTPSPAEGEFLFRLGENLWKPYREDAGENLLTKIPPRTHSPIECR